MLFRAAVGGRPLNRASSSSSTCRYWPVAPPSTLAKIEFSRIVKSPSLILSALRTPGRPAGLGKLLVSTIPGLMVLTATPLFFSSAAKVAAMPSSANLEVTYGPIDGIPILPARELTMTMSPPDSSMVCRSTAPLTAATLTTLSSRSCLRAGIGCSKRGAFPPSPAPPALLINKSMPPKAATAAATPCSTATSSVTSATIGINTLLSALRRDAFSATTSLSSAAVRDMIATFAPSAAQINAIAFPIPRPPPVTNTRRPLRTEAPGEQSAANEWAVTDV
mmetsp:Transcript_6768/g.12554  ORF Transcript_6768/g.12554 Transcript_6768/m.12554 type:complete len:278 (-) Transcript_6768:56-889(-)